MCGIIASILADTSQNVSADLYEGLSILQHRGQDAAGIVTAANKGRLYQCKGNGMVRDVFDEDHLQRLIGYQGVGHVRYPTAGGSSLSEAQPFYVNSPYGIVLAHNGNLTNTADLKVYLDTKAHRHINTDSDSELLLNIFAECLSQAGKVRVNEDDVFKAIEGVMQKCIGGFACVSMIPGFGIIAFRDPFGIRPAVYGKRKSRTIENGFDYMVASESVALDVLGYTEFIDINPGEAIIITKNGLSVKQCSPVDHHKVSPCIFEYVYFARPDSIMNGISVYKSRLAMGVALAKQVISHFKNKGHDNVKDVIDVIIPVPDTSRVAALQLSYKLDIPYREGFIKNRYVGRTFIMPGQSLRQKSVRRKLNPMKMEFFGKNVLLVDDSVVRGTTSKEIILMAKESGAKKVFFASCAPPIRYPNVYGIDMPTRQELIAYGRTEDQVAEAICADEMIFQDLNDLLEACQSTELQCGKQSKEITRFDVSVFDGNYITGDVDEDYLNSLERIRSRKTSQSQPEVTQITSKNGIKQTMSHSEIVSPLDIDQPLKSNESDSVGLFNNYIQ